ncbi:MAG TPA: PilZ domain-containing protein [Desulfurivibrionaceae bacterium]|nr:PilZ domain-containing protein [Desulfurivibrionaceae bacterium]
MAANESSRERRLFTRFPVRDNAMIAINSHLGELIDISFGGLAFRYAGAKPWPRQKRQLAMLCGADDFCLQVPLSMVSDSPVASAEGGVMRRRSMRFGELDAQQLIQLIAFIRDNTLDQEIPEAGAMMPSA